MLTPVKLVKGEADCIRQREKAYRDLYSSAVSKIRQPVESFFNWLNEKTQIQNAQKSGLRKVWLYTSLEKLPLHSSFLYFNP